MKTSAVSDAVSPSQTHVLHTADTQRLFLAHEISLCVYTIQCLPALVFGYTPRNELFVASCSGSWAGFDSDDRWDWEAMQWYHLQCRPAFASLMPAETQTHQTKSARAPVLSSDSICSGCLLRIAVCMRIYVILLMQNY